MREIILEDYNSLFNITIWILRSFLLLTILVFVAFIIILKMKRGDNRLRIKMLIIEILGEFSKKIYNFIIKIIPLMIIFVIIRVVLIKEIFDFFQNSINKYKDPFLILFGAIISSLVSYLFSILKEIREKKNTLNCEAMMLAYNLEQLEEKILLLSVASNRNSESIVVMDKPEIISDWVSRYESICSQLTYEHYTYICKLATKVEQLNNQISEEKFEQARQTINLLKVLIDGDTKHLSSRLSLYEVIEDIKIAAQNRKVKCRLFSRLQEERVFSKEVKKNQQEIKKILFDEIKNSDQNECAIIDELVLGKIRDNKLFDEKKSDKYILDVIFTVSFSSKRFKRIWGEYFLEEE